MELNLLVCKQLEREHFLNETYVGEDDVFALVEQGLFVFDNGNGLEKVGPLEAVNFKRGVQYNRRVVEKTTMYLFRYQSDVPIFGSGKIVFQDRERIRSTLRLLGRSEGLLQPGDFACKRALFGDLVNQYLLENAPQLQDNGFEDKAISDAVAFMNENLHKKLNLNQLADKCFLSYVQFSRRFKQATGTTPQNYLMGLRLKKAQNLLQETELPIKGVAQLCGFESEYYFSNFFRSQCAVTPTQFRNLVKTTEDLQR